MGASSSTEAEREPLLAPSRVETTSHPVNSRVYGRRWLVLTLFSLLGLMQGMVWNFWGPIQNSAVRAYGFSKSDIAVLVLWGPLGFVPWLLFMWLLDKKGELLNWDTVSWRLVTRTPPQGCGHMRSLITNASNRVIFD